MQVQFGIQTNYYQFLLVHVITAINDLATENFKENKNKIIQYTGPSSFVIQ
jgi:hypothetical protein